MPSLTFTRLATAALLCLGVSGPSLAALNCEADAHSRPVEHTLCQHPRLVRLDTALDQQIATAADAGPTITDALMRDQANWQSQTLSIAWQTIQADHEALTPRLRPRYRHRLAYLEALADTSQGPAARIAGALARLAPGEDIVERLATGDAIRPAETHRYDSAGAALDTLAIDTTSATRQALIDTFEPGPVRLSWLEETGIGLLLQSQGSAHCPVTAAFRRDATGHWVPVVNPLATESARRNACGQPIELFSIAGTPTLTLIETRNANEIAIHLYTMHDASAWQAGPTVVARYDHTLKATAIRHRDDSNAYFWQRLALPVAEAFDRRPVPGFSRSALSPRNNARIETARRAVLADAAGEGLAAAPLTTADNTLGPFDHFGEAAVFFPIAARGNWVLGRIGHGRLGWRTSDDWLMGFWGLDADDRVVPLASLTIERRRGAALGQAVIAPD